MKKDQIIVSFDNEKVSALKIYLGQRNTTIEKEFQKSLDALYIKNVPAGVRDYIEARAEHKQSSSEKKIVSLSAVAVNDSNEGDAP